MNTLTERYDIHKKVFVQTGANSLNSVTEFKSVHDVFKQKKDFSHKHMHKRKQIKSLKELRKIKNMQTN